MTMLTTSVLNVLPELIRIKMDSVGLLTPTAKSSMKSWVSVRSALGGMKKSVENVRGRTPSSGGDFL
jgi:hypothetical protein